MCVIAMSLKDFGPKTCEGRHFAALAAAVLLSSGGNNSSLSHFELQVISTRIN